MALPGRVPAETTRPSPRGGAGTIRRACGPRGSRRAGRRRCCRPRRCRRSGPRRRGPTSAAATASAPAPSAITRARSASSRTAAAVSSSVSAMPPASNGLRALPHRAEQHLAARRRRRTTACSRPRPGCRPRSDAANGAPVSGSQASTRVAGLSERERARDPGRQAAAAPGDEHGVDRRRDPRPARGRSCRCRPSPASSSTGWTK